MASTFKAVSDTMLDMNFPTYVVKSRGGSMIGYQLDKKMNVEESIDRLKKLLLEQTGDIAKVEINPKSGGTGGGDSFKCIKMDVDLSTIPGRAVSGVVQHVGQGVSGDMQKLFEKQNAEILALKEKLIALEYQAKIDKLQEQISGIQENDPIGKITEMLVPVLAQYLPSLLAPKDSRAINGLESETVTTNANLSPRDRAKLLAGELCDIDPDADKIIAAIYIIASKDIDSYNNYKPMLVAFAQKIES